jgi:arsenate reductase (glutaredoxin)
VTQPTLWHNPRCSKSRQTLTLLQNAGYAPVIVEYLETTPTRAEIRAALKHLGIKAADLIRPREKTFKTLGLSLLDPPDRLIAAMAAHPILIERPVVFFQNRAVIGRPPEAALELLATTLPQAPDA